MAICGASKTISVVSSEEKERVAREAGADEVVRSDGPWKDEARELTGGSGALGTIYVGMSFPEGAKGFQNNFQNRNVTIEGNRIDNSFIYGIFVGNADGVKIIDNVVGQTFIRGSFDAGKFYGATPDSGIFIGGSKNAEITNNKVARGRVAKLAVAVDRTCVKDSIRLANNVLA